MSTSERWDVDWHTARCISPVTVVLLSAREMEISVAVYALWLRKDFTLFYVVIILILPMQARSVVISSQWLD